MDLAGRVYKMGRMVCYCTFPTVIMVLCYKAIQTGDCNNLPKESWFDLLIHNSHDLEKGENEFSGDPILLGD